MFIRAAPRVLVLLCVWWHGYMLAEHDCAGKCRATGRVQDIEGICAGESGTFYIADYQSCEAHLQDEAAIAEAERKASSLGFLAADWTFCAVTFILSDILYLGGASSLQISATLGLIAALNWKLFDGTKPGQAVLPRCLILRTSTCPPQQQQREGRSHGSQTGSYHRETSKWHPQSVQARQSRTFLSNTT